MCEKTPANWRSAIFSQLNGVELYYTQRIIMTKDWKYVYNGFDYDELYDLRNDPHEMHNLAFPDLTAKRAEVRAVKGNGRNQTVPWLPLPEHLAAVRKDPLDADVEVCRREPRHDLQPLRRRLHSRQSDRGSRRIREKRSPFVRNRHFISGTRQNL